MEILNTQVYGIIPTMIRSGYPMSTDISYMDPHNAYSPYEVVDEDSREFGRLARLGKAPMSSGHDCALKGIIVQCDIEAPAYWWPQFQRYHFADIISSQSKMHRIEELAVRGRPDFVYPEIWAEFLILLGKYKENLVSLEALLSNAPQGLELTAGITTNYLQIKTMYAQRKNHRLYMWNTVFVNWVERLPYAEEFGLLGELK